MKLWKKLAIIVPAVIVVGAVAYVLTHSGIGIDKNNLPKFVTANFIDLDKIFSISKFRSGTGHDFSGGGETCRSMKHYIVPQADSAAREYEKSNDGIPYPPDGKTDIPIYAPFDGTITQIGEERHPVGKQIFLVPDHANSFTVRLFHVYPVEGMTAGFIGLGGSHVTAGQKIGVIAAHSDTDVSVQIGTMPWNDTFVSVFDVMDDSVFAAYQKRGVADRSDLVITKDYRDANPLKCVSDKTEAFVEDAAANESNREGFDPNYFYLTGYVPPVQIDTNVPKTNQ